jgi:glycyl-tRNA synthetase beta chain
VPTEPVSVAVALADKMDTLTGFWAIDEKPTGSKDPFALRRAGLGVIRFSVRLKNLRLRSLFQRLILEILEELYFVELIKVQNKLTDVNELISDKQKYAAEFTSVGKEVDDLLVEKSRLVALETEKKERLSALSEPNNESEVKASDLLAFLHDRLKVYLRDQGIRHDVIDACLAMPGNDDLTLLVKRAEALAAFLKTEDGPNLLQGYKRANTILTQAEAKDGVEYSYGADIKFAETEEERALFAALDRAEAAINPAMQAEDFAGAMAAMAQLRAPIDAFFTAVQVNSDNSVTRRNRLNLLHRIRAICSGVADLTKVEG